MKTIMVIQPIFTLTPNIVTPNIAPVHKTLSPGCRK